MLDAQATQEPLFNDVLENFWYQLNPMMVELIVGHFSPQDELPVKLRTQNLTTIMVANIPVLLDYVHEYPGYYVDNVFDELPDNTMESEAAISYLIKEEEISLEKRVRVLEKSERRLRTIDKAPPELWPEVLRLSRIVATWANLYPVYAAGKSITAEMAAFMNLPENYAQLAKAKLAEVSGVEEKMLEAFGLKVLVSPAIAVPAKRQLLPQLGFYYTDPDLSALNREQVEVILSADRLNFSVETYQFLQASHAGLQLVYAENNLESFFDEVENLALKDLDYRLLLASERLSSTQHEILIQKLDFGELAHDPELTAIVTRLLLRTGFMPSIAQSKLLLVFSYSEDNDLRKHLLLKYLPTLSEAQTGELLSHMSEDYAELPNYRQPKMADTLLNKSLLSALQIKGYYVSSFPEKKGRLNVYTRSRPAE
ncbi:hypothetical protein GCM10023313_24310 [Mucilaginibacter defluvii]|uniref:Uncharacterized protein n=2 Tax=Mucilaginibacter defluvii TaxID=1196019 RepID=A0ABP9G2T5_9SPHI